MPKFSPSRSRRSAISWRDFLPKFLTCRIWPSVRRTRSPSVRTFEFLSELTLRTESSRSSSGGRRRAPVRRAGAPARGGGVEGGGVRAGESRGGGGVAAVDRAGAVAGARRVRAEAREVLEV